MNIRKNKKFLFLVVVFTVMTVFLLLRIKVYAHDIEDVSYIWDYLELDHIFTDFARSFGNKIYEILSSILDFCYNGFTELMNFNILDLDIAKKVVTNMDKVVYSLLFIAFVVVVVILICLQWFQVNIFGKIAMAKGFNDFQQVGGVFSSALKTLMAQVIMYFSMLCFSFLCSEIMTTTKLSNWLVKDILIFGIGMAIVVGSGFINEYLGIDDGSGFALKSIFMGGRLARIPKKGYDLAKDTVKNGYKAGKFAYGYMKDKYNEPLQGSANDIFGAFHNNRDDDNYNGSNGLPPKSPAPSPDGSNGFRPSRYSPSPFTDNSENSNSNNDLKNKHNQYEDMLNEHSSNNKYNDKLNDDNLKADRDFYFDNSRYDTRDKFVRKDLGKEKNDKINKAGTDFSEYDDYLKDD